MTRPPSRSPARISAIVARWRVSLRPEVRRAFHERLAESRLSRSALKTQLIETGLLIAEAAGVSGVRLEREAIKAAECDLLDLPYPERPSADVVADTALLSALLEADSVDTSYETDQQRRARERREKRRLNSRRDELTVAQRKLIDALLFLEREGAVPSIAEAARRVGIAESTAYVQVHRIRSAARRQM